MSHADSSDRQTLNAEARSANDLTPEEQQILDETDRFARGELYPLAARMDADEWWPGDLFPRLGTAGYLGITIPEEYGGVGSTLVASGLVLQAVSRILKRTGEGALTSNQLGEQAMLFLDMQRSGVLRAQVFWGLWLLPLSSLVVASGFLTKWLGLPVLIAAAGYLIDSAMHVLLPGGRPISQFTAAGELALPLWLLTKGIDRQQWIGRQDV